MHISSRSLRPLIVAIAAAGALIAAVPSAHAITLNPQPEPPGIVDPHGQPQSAWPAKIEIGALKAGASEVLM